MWTYILIYNRFSFDWFVRLFQVRFWTLISAFSSNLCVFVIRHIHTQRWWEKELETVSRGEINLHIKYWSQIIGHFLNNKSVAHPLVIIYKSFFYWCIVSNIFASQNKCQLVSDAHFLNWCIASLTFFADGLSESENLPITSTRGALIRYPGSVSLRCWPFLLDRGVGLTRQI